MAENRLESLRRDRLATGALLAAAAAWGATFVVVKGAIAHMGVESFLAWRFLLAGALLAAAKPRALLGLRKGEWLQGAGLGLTLACGYALQTAGLRTTPAAVSGFLTGLQVVFTPLLAWALFRHRVGLRVLGAILLATAGLAAISEPGLAGRQSYGEVLTMASAGAFALQVACLGRWSTPANAYGLATVELLTVAGLSLMATLPRGPSAPTGGATWAAVASTAAIATAGTFVVQSWAQSRLSTARANIVLTSEPLFAALAALAAGEVLSFWLLAGGALIVGAMVVASPGTRLASVLARRPVIAIAHRGDPMGQRENTLEAFASARALGADMVELDCRTTRDGQAVVVHDATLERLWGIPKAVSEVEWADLAHVRSAGWRVPLLEEVLASVDLPVMVDLPDPAAAQPAYQVVLRCGALQRCYFAGHTTGLCQVRQLSSAANIALTWDKQELPPAPLLATLRPQWWNPYHRLASPQTVEWAHAAGMGVSVWTVDRSGDVQKALAAGVDAVVSNRIRLLLDVLGRPGGTPKPAAG